MAYQLRCMLAALEPLIKVFVAVINQPPILHKDAAVAGQVRPVLIQLQAQLMTQRLVVLVFLPL